MVPDNVTLGAPGNSMGLITEETRETSKNYESDDHTLGVELDTQWNLEFNDTNNNHIGINLASMNSTLSIKPVYPLASSSATQYQQIWIVYSEADSRMDIYYARYEDGKPAKPQGSLSGLNLTLLKEKMFIGFSSANTLGSTDTPYVCAWSFSNDGIPAPPIVIAEDATPGAPPPPAPITTTPPAPNVPVPVAAPSLPSPSPPPVPTRSPISSPPAPPPPSNPPPSRAPNPPPFNLPNSPPPSSDPPEVPWNGEPPPTITKKGRKKKKKNLAGVYVGASVAAVRLFVAIVGLFIYVLCCYLRHPVRIYACHAGGKGRSEKGFPTSLVKEMRRYFRWSNITIFFDKDNVRSGESIPTRIFEELAQTDVGIVVVTDDLFQSKWPMTELIALIDKREKDTSKKFIVLPLFYKLMPEDMKDPKRRGTWESAWEKMSMARHPLDVEKCRHALDELRGISGIAYGYKDPDHDDKYIKDICPEVDKIRRARSFASYLRAGPRG